MSDINWPIGEDEVTEAIVDSDVIGLYQLNAVAVGKKQRRMTFQILREWLADNLVSINGRKLNADRIDSQELTSGSLSVSGWYTIAETDTTESAFSCDISVMDKTVGRMGSCEFAAIPSTSPKTHQNTTLKLKKGAGTSSDSWVADVTGFRLAKSDSVSDSGFKIQVYLTPPSARPYNIQIVNNLGDVSGAFLVTPYLDNTPTLPDGVTAGTFLEAGEEFLFDTTLTAFVPNIVGFRVSDDAIKVTVDMPEIPKQGTGATLTMPATTLLVYDGEGVNNTITGSSTTSTFDQFGKTILFNINETGIGAGLNAGVVHLRAAGGGFKVTIDT